MAIPIEISFVGFDSAWADNPRAPGAICALTLTDGKGARFHAPRLVSFGDALAFLATVRPCRGVTLVALDQPTIVRNDAGMRPAERAAASLISWLGGGVQPANRARIGMFCDAAPVWRFLAALDAVDDPERARIAENGVFVMEVFPSLALASIQAAFFGRLAAPRYNPARRKTYRSADWSRVAGSAARAFEAIGLSEAATWYASAAAIDTPRKADHDRLDAMLCLLVALHWRLRPRAASIMLGDLIDGYIVAPASEPVRERLTAAARRLGVPVDGVVPA